MSEETIWKSRRGLLTGSAVTLSAAGVMALIGMPAAAATGAAHAGQDTQLLNAALALEDEGIAAYQIGAESHLLTADVTKLALTFQGHHKQHREDLIVAIKRLGGKPVEPKALSQYAQELNAASLKDQTGVLRLALKLERGATNAYLGLIPSLDQPELYLLAARTATDESFHAAVLGHALGEPVPQKAPLFG